MLSTHVLDLTTGRPAAGMKIELRRLSPEPALLKAVVTNADGRTDGPMLDASAMKVGVYELLFFAGDYFAAQTRLATKSDSAADSLVRFLDQVPIRFGMGNVDVSYHVPLLVTPFAYSTYRGS